MIRLALECFTDKHLVKDIIENIGFIVKNSLWNLNLFEDVIYFSKFYNLNKEFL